MKKITVSVVVYKNYKDVEKMIESLERYTNNEIEKEIYIIDNGTKFSKESDKNEFIKNISKYTDVQYIDSGDNLGFGKGHNKILNKIESDYHAIVNPDIIFIEDSFSKIIEYLNKNPNIGMVIPKIIDEKGNIQKVYRKEVSIKDMFLRRFFSKIFLKYINDITLQDMDYTQEFQVPFGQGSFLVIRTDLFKKLNGFDERFFMYMEDADLCKRVNQESKLMYCPYTKIIHKWEKGSHKNIKLFFYHVVSMKKYFIKWRKK